MRARVLLCFRVLCNLSFMKRDSPVGRKKERSRKGHSPEQQWRRKAVGKLFVNPRAQVEGRLLQKRVHSRSDHSWGGNWKKAEVRLCDQGETHSSSGNKFLEIKVVTECEWLLSWRDSPQMNMLLFPQTVTTTEQNIQKMRENRTSRSLSSNGNTGSWFLMTYPSLPIGSALLSGGSICGINDLCQCSIQTLIYLYASKWTSLLGWTHLVEITNPSASVQSHSCGTCSPSKEGKCIVIT